MKNKLITPITIFFFNRPSKLEKLLRVLVKVDYSKVYCVQDGPRDIVKSDFEKVKECQSLVDRYLDSDKCHYLYSEKNIGIRERIQSGIEFVLSQEKCSIFLEDDCIPHPDFFRFTEELLKKYQNDLRIGMITGYNHFNQFNFGGFSYGLSKFGSIFGWATWSDRWEMHDKTMKNINDYGVKNYIVNNRTPRRSGQKRYNLYIHYHNSIINKNISTWAFQWAFTREMNSLLTIVPEKSLVSNIGDDAESLHNDFENDSDSIFKSLFHSKVHKINWPLKHPKYIFPSQDYDYALNSMMDPSIFVRFKKRLKNILKKLF